jgi:hypothetical protein
MEGEMSTRHYVVETASGDAWLVENARDAEHALAAYEDGGAEAHIRVRPLHGVRSEAEWLRARGRATNAEGR